MLNKLINLAQTIIRPKTNKACIDYQDIGK